MTITHPPAELLQSLIRFDTTNPPGNEAACIGFIKDLLTQAGFDALILAKDPNRPNLIARLTGRGEAPALLLQGHVDVVTTAGQPWTHPPFEAQRHEGYIWGRGALDMKGGVAMMLAALLRAKAEKLAPRGDVVLCVLSDEEAGGDYGAKWLVETQADVFKGVRYALGEFGGFTAYFGGRRFYLIQVAERQMCWMRATVRGPAGHGGAVVMRGGAMAKLSRLLWQLDRNLLPVHITSPVRMMIEAMRAALPFPARSLMRQLLNPSMTDRVLGLLGERGKPFLPMLRNTVNATLVRGGEKINVIPGEITVELDGRLLPGFTPDDMLKELRLLVGEDVELEVLRAEVSASPAQPDMGLFETLASVLREADPTGIPIPYMLPAISDARFFAKLGIQPYGFTPMQLPPDFNFSATVHAADERIPVEAVEFGASAIYEVLRRL